MRDALEFYVHEADWDERWMLFSKHSYDCEATARLLLNYGSVYTEQGLRQDT